MWLENKIIKLRIIMKFLCKSVLAEVNKLKFGTWVRPGQFCFWKLYGNEGDIRVPMDSYQMIAIDDRCYYDRDW